MTVTGIITNPAHTLATAPAARFCVLESFGSTELLRFVVPSLMLDVVLPDFFASPFATACRNQLRVVKYRAEPKPVRIAEGVVPRQRLGTGCGEANIERMTGKSEDDRDCCTRVFSKSAGCRRIDVQSPEASPATKWKVG